MEDDEMRYPEDYVNKIIQDDCLEVMRGMLDKSVDLIVADPPYNIGKDYGEYKDNLSIEDYYKWCYEWLTECIRILKKTGSLFVMNYPEHLAYFKVFLDKHLEFVNWITWIRNDNQPYNKKRKFKKNHQDILFYVVDKNIHCFNWRAVARKPIWDKDKRVKDLAGQPDTWDMTYVKGNSPEKTMVNNQLPIELIGRIILSTTNDNNIVLDPFLGSGTTAVSCKKLNRRFIGIEINPKYCEIARKRVANVPEKLERWIKKNAKVFK